MKKIIALVFCWVLVLSVHAQPYYFSRRMETYQEITNDTSIDNGRTWGGVQGIVLPIGFTYKFMGQNFTQFRLETTARLVFDPSTHFYYADGFAAVGIQDRGYSKGLNLSKRTYKVEGSIGNRIMKIQVKNAGCASDTSVFMNFQLWLYEGSNDFELHMGPNNVTASTSFVLGPLSGVHHLKSITPLNYDYGLMVYGNTAMPDDSTLSSSGVVFDNYELQGSPVANTVYKYSLQPPTSIQEPRRDKTGLIIYPTITTGMVYAKTSIEVEKVSLLDLNGSCVRESNDYPLNINDLPNGVYCLKTSDKSGKTFFSRVVKQ
ncbi:MAG: T9SS type A sorting domain-containing protein [Flavipsychrobacter sp.]